MDFTERAARIGEAGGQVTTFLGRTSPPVDERFREIVADRSSPAAESRAVSTARAHGRMTRNFIVQGTACLLYTSPSPRDVEESRMPSSA